MTKKILKKVLITIIVVVVIGAIIVAVRYLNSSKEDVFGLSNRAEEEVISNSQLTELKGSGLQKVAENSQLSLNVDFGDGNIEIVDKQNGYVWRSKPSEEDLKKENSNQLWKDNISSPILFEYVNEYTSAKTTFGNVNNQNTKIQVFQLDHGVRVYFDFTKSGIHIAYDVVLHDNHIEVSIPSYLIQEPGVKYLKNAVGSKIVDKKETVLLTDITLFPFLGAARSDQGEEGYLLLPDGPGALVKFDSDKGLNSQFIGTVYGKDLSYLNQYDSTLMNALWESKILFPVFGIVRNDNSLMGIIDQGETNADIIGSPAGVQTGFNSVYARFTYRNKFKVITSPSDGNGYFRYTDSGINLGRTIQYYFHHGKDANYVGMAQAYRDYLAETNGINKQNSNGNETPLQLNIYGGTMKDNFVGRSFVSMTTFKQAEEIVNFFKDNDVNQVDVTYIGWGSKGDPVGLPYRFPAASKLGGNNGLSDFVKYTQERGYRVFLSDDWVSADTRKGISLKNDAIANVLGNPLEVYDDLYMLNPGAMQKFFDKSMTQYHKYGIDGIEEYGVGWFLNTDFNRSQPVGRDDMKTYYTDMMNEARDQFSSMRVANPMAYLLSDRTTIVNMPMDGSYLTVLDETVPFYEIALHGLVPYVFGDYNQHSEPEEQVLKAVEFGGNISFTVTYEPTERLKDVYGNWLLSSEFSVWKDTVLSQYRRLATVLDEIQGQYMTGYEKLTPNVSVVTYENGTTVVCNYANQPFTYKERTVNPKDFILIKGQG